MTESNPTARQADMLVNRIRKRMRQLKRWMTQEGVSCYRLYDRDIPEIPLTIDFYEGRLVVWLYEKRHAISDPEAWLRAMAQALSQGLGIDIDNIFLKRRIQAEGGTQYSTQGELTDLISVREGGHTFWVNFTDYVDTGLFLDHRTTRKIVQEMSRDKEVLNLFAYTGAFSVYAAAGGASSVTTVDLSNTYLNWAKKNMAENGFEGSVYRYVRDDVLAKLETKAVEGMYDIIILDPPTISKSKRMARGFDVQQDHELLINRLLKQLSPEGTLFFSNNFRKFRLGTGINGSTEEITDRTCPEDFKARPPHRCWKITHF